MKASVVDLRYKMKDVLSALRKRENVEILYHGQAIAKIVPLEDKQKKGNLSKHPFFGMHRDLGVNVKAVKKTMDNLRGDRYRDL